MAKKLYVGGISYSTNDSALKDAFAKAGEVTSATIIMDKMTGRSKGFGFVTFANEADAEKAVTEMAEKEVDGRKIVVNVAKPREEGGNRGGGGFQRNNQRRF